MPFALAACKPGRAKAMIGWYRAAIRAGLRSGRSRAEHDRSYATITSPTLLVWGMDDRALGYEDVVPGTDRYVERLEIQTIPNCGHFVQQEQPDEINRRVLAFLRAP